ncbi:MAG: chemotaxis response regulator protein-glutamate methylesterase [Steroidobacterales bacterium]
MKIGIVNDLPLAIEALRRAIALRPEHRIIWVAYDGAQAVTACARETPDLVLMDLVMPVMDGVEATRQIMTNTPCAILLVTANVGVNAARVFEAMGCGALDAVDTPALGAKNAPNGATTMLAKIDSIGKLLGSTCRHPSAPEVDAVVRPISQQSRLVAIGASAGGPAALAILLSALPRDFPAAIVIVQHVDAQFAIGMADWLSAQSKLPVRVAREGDRPMIGQVLLAGTSDHLILSASGRLGYTPDPIDYAYRPSVDVFFQSVCRFWPFEAVGVQLTGMGRDGALGLRALRNKGYHTIAQDQASSAVYGMPKAAAALDAAVDILPLERIASRLVDVINQ